MTALGSFRDRITLMREQKTAGAGGRQTLLTPIIADVWAAAEEAQGSLVSTAGGQRAVRRATFRTHAGDGYDGTRRIAWNGRTFRVEGSRTYGPARRFIEFSTRELLP